MRTNKKVFWFSIITTLVSAIGIIVLITLKDCQEWLEVLLNIFISFLGGAFLSAVLAYVNFYSIKFQHEQDFNKYYVKCFELISHIANWYLLKEKMVNYTVNYSGIDENDISARIKAKIDNNNANKPYIEDLYSRIVKMADFEFDSMYAITDDYCNTIWKPKERKIQGILEHMIKMTKAVREYDYLLDTQTNANVTRYEEGVVDEYCFYREVSPFFKKLMGESRLDNLLQLQSDLLHFTKMNEKIDKHYNNTQTKQWAILLSIKNHFSKLINRLRKRISMERNTFFQKYWVILLVLTVLPIVGLFIFCNFLSPGNDASAWSSMIAGLFTYIGSTVLAIIVFYHTYIVERKHEENEAMRFSIYTHSKLENDCLVPYSLGEIDNNYKYSGVHFFKRIAPQNIDDYVYVKTRIYNYNKEYPITVKIQGIHYIDGLGQVNSCDFYEIKSVEEINLPIDFKEKRDMFIGFPIKIIDKDLYQGQKYFIAFISYEFTDGLGKKEYVIEEVRLGKNYGVGKRRLTPKKYEKLIRKNGHPIVLEPEHLEHIKKNKEIIQGQKNSNKEEE